MNIFEIKVSLAVVSIDCMNIEHSKKVHSNLHISEPLNPVALDF